MYMWTYKSNLLSLATMVISNVFLWCKQRKYVQPAPIIQVGYYPSFQILAAFRTIYNAKPRVLDAIEHRFGKRSLSTLTSANRPFHILEHVETLWLKHFATYLCQHTDIASLIWLHDGVWISPLPSPNILLAANRAASSHLGLEAPLVLKTLEFTQAAQSAQAELLAGRPPPSSDPPAVLHAPRPSVMPVLSEPRAQAAFLRMMARAARSGSHSHDPADIIVLDP